MSICSEARYEAGSIYGCQYERQDAHGPHDNDDERKYKPSERSRRLDIRKPKDKEKRGTAHDSVQMSIDCHQTSQCKQCQQLHVSSVPISHKLCKDHSLNTTNSKKNWIGANFY